LLQLNTISLVFVQSFLISRMPMSMAPSGTRHSRISLVKPSLVELFFFFLKTIKNYILNYSWIYKSSYYNLGFRSKMNVRKKTRFVVNIFVIVYTTWVTRILPWAELILLQCKHRCLDASSVLKKKNYSSSNFTVSKKIILFNYTEKKTTWSIFLKYFFKKKTMVTTRRKYSLSKGKINLQS